MLACVDGKQTRSEAIKNYHLRILIRTPKLLRHWIRRAYRWGSGCTGCPGCPGSCCFCFAARENKYRFHPLSPATHTAHHPQWLPNKGSEREKKPREEKNHPPMGGIHPSRANFPPPPNAWQRQTTLTKLTPVFRTLGSQDTGTPGLQDSWTHPSSESNH